MRTLVLGIVAAAGMGLAATSATLAAPLNGSVITGQAATENPIVNVGHCRYSRWSWRCGHRHHWRWSRRR